MDAPPEIYSTPIAKRGKIHHDFFLNNSFMYFVVLILAHQEFGIVDLIQKWKFNL